MSRLAAERWGRRAEALAALWLRAKGYAVLARRVRTPVGEIDLVARRGKVLVFVEVKARLEPGQAREALSPQALARVRRAAEALSARYSTPDTQTIRLDAVLVTPWRFPVHLENISAP